MSSDFHIESYNGVNFTISRSELGLGWSLWLDDQLVDQALLKGCMERTNSATMDAIALVARGLIDNIIALIEARLSDPIYRHISADDKELIARPYTSADHKLP